MERSIKRLDGAEFSILATRTKTQSEVPVPKKVIPLNVK